MSSYFKKVLMLEFKRIEDMFVVVLVFCFVFGVMLFWGKRGKEKKEEKKREKKEKRKEE